MLKRRFPAAVVAVTLAGVGPLADLAPVYAQVRAQAPVSVVPAFAPAVVSPAAAALPTLDLGLDFGLDLDLDLGLGAQTLPGLETGPVAPLSPILESPDQALPQGARPMQAGLAPVTRNLARPGISPAEAAAAGYTIEALLTALEPARHDGAVAWDAPARARALRANRIQRPAGFETRNDPSATPPPSPDLRPEPPGTRSLPPGPFRLFPTIRAFLTELIHGDPVMKPFLKKYHKAVIGSSVLLTLVGLGGVAATRIMGMLYDAAIASDPTMLGVYAGIILGMSVLFAAVQMWHDRLIQRTRIDFSRDVRSHLYDHLLLQPSKLFDKEKPAELAGRLINDVGNIPTKNITSRVAFPYYMTMFGISAAIMIFTSWKLALAAAILTPLLVWLSVRYGKKRETLETKIAQARAEMIRTAEGGLTREREIKVVGARDAQSRTFWDKVQAYRDALIENMKLTTGYDFYFGQLNLASSHFAVIFLGLFAHVFLGEPSVGSVIAMAGFAGYMRAAFQGLLGLYTNNRAAEGASKRVLELIRKRPLIEDRPEAAALEPLDDSIRLVNASIAGESGEPLLDQAGLRFKRGQRTAILHADGNELAPVAELLLRLRDPEAGSVRWDGVDVRDATSASVRRRVGLLDPQSTFLPGTIRENLAYAAPEAGEAAMTEALKAVKAHFILNTARFPNGLDTDYDRIDQTLSGREKRLLVLARLLLQDPEVVVLNGTEGGLEGVDRMLFEVALDNVLEGRTVVWLWPKVARLEKMDRILVLKDGRVAEKGTHAELLESGELYRELLKAISKL